MNGGNAMWLTKGGNLTRDFPWGGFDDVFAGVFDNGFGSIAKTAKQVDLSNVWSDDFGYVIELVAIGVPKEKFNIDIKEGVLTISCKQEAEKEDELKKWTQREFYRSSYSKSWKLPENVDVKHIAAKMENGILTIGIPKVTPPEPEITTIKIK